MDSKLEDILQTAGVDPAMANQLVVDGWTFRLLHVAHWTCRTSTNPWMKSWLVVTL